jgi:Zn-dependent metalloprotease
MNHKAAGRYGSTKHIPCCLVVAPYILESIAYNAKGAASKAALNSLTATMRLTGQRDRAPMRVAALTEGAKTRTVSNCRHSQRLPGVMVRRENSQDTGTLNVDQAYAGAGTTYDLYLSAFGRNSLDGRGLELDSSVSYGRSYQNAFWQGERMVYGDGDGHIFGSFTSCLDVIGHELSHGFSQYTSNLQYQGQSGALNEHVSDAFGVMVKQWSKRQTADQADWLVGAELLMPGINGRGIRDLMNPGTAYDDARLGKDPQPASMDDYIQTEEDAGGVHLNSGIPNRAFAVACVAAGGFSWEKVGRVWYETCTRYLTYSSDFADMAKGTVQNAAALFGAGGPVELAVRSGWDAVKIRV